MDFGLPPQLKLLLDCLLSRTCVSELTPEQVQVLSDMETLHFALPFFMRMPVELQNQMGDDFLPYLDFILNDMSIRERNGQLSPDWKMSLKRVSEKQIELGDLNPDTSFQVLRLMKLHQVPVSKASINQLFMQDATSHSPKQRYKPVEEDPGNDLTRLIEAEGINTGLGFCQFMASELAVLDSFVVKVMLELFEQNSWLPDALLLLTMYPDKELAEVAAEVLNQLPEERWSDISNRNYLTLVQRFGPESVRHYLPEWNKWAMKYTRSRPVPEVTDLQVSFIDGSGAALFCGLMEEDQVLHMFGGVFKLGYGIIDSYFQPRIERVHYEKTTAGIWQDTRAEMCDPEILGQIMPWALGLQQNSGEPLSANAFQILAMLPSAWVQPQVFGLGDIAALCKVDLSDNQLIETARANSNSLRDIPQINTWQAGEYKTSIRKQYIQSLAFTALVTHYSKNEHPGTPKTCMGCAAALHGGIGEQEPFPLFDWLTSLSLKQG